MEDKANIIETFSEMAPRYERVVDSELNRIWGWRYSAFVKLIIASTPMQPQDIVLDVATGTGVIPDALEKSGHPLGQIHGLDITLSMLVRAKVRLSGQEDLPAQNLVCASAMEMPYSGSAFSQVICGLATHHMNVKELISECHRVLQMGGRLTIADVGGSTLWKVPGVRFLVRMAAYLYFFLFENRSRALAESRAVFNILTGDDWNQVLLSFGFRNINILKLRSRYFWVPAPLLIKAEK